MVGFFQGVLTGRYSDGLAFRTFLRNVDEYLPKFGKDERTCGLPWPEYAITAKIEIIPKTTTDLEQIGLFTTAVPFTSILDLRLLHRLPLHV